MKNQLPFLMESAPGAETVIDGRRRLYFAGTGYLGLHGHSEIIRAGREAFACGTHSGTTRSGFGTTPALLDLERNLADFFGTADAVSYVSGYLNGLFLAQGLAEDFDAAFVDETSHPSLLEGIASTRKKTVFFKHRDPDDLRRKLKTQLQAAKRPAVFTDGVFPTFGEIAPVPDLLAVLEPYRGLFCLDDAHGVGILGAAGRGTLDHFGVAPSGRVFMAATLSKAFGGYGGFIPGSRPVVRRFRGKVRAYSGSSPMPTPIAAASVKAIELARRHPEWRETLRANVKRAKAGFRALGFAVGDSPVPILTWTLPNVRAMTRIQRLLFDRDIAVAYLNYVGAPAGGVLRATIFSTHTPDQIDRLIAELGRLV